MRFCDLTLAYTTTSGGIRTYIDAKRKYLAASRPEDEQILLIPGDEDGVETEGQFTVVTIDSPIIPGCAPYRFFWRPGPLLDALDEMRPDAIELGSFFVCPWTAFRHREKRRKEGERCLVSAYFHTDVANAYFGAPIRNVFRREVSGWSETLFEWGLNLAESVERGARNHFGHIFEQCDLLFAATDVQRQSIMDYGVDHAHVVPLGVDLDLFHPRKRNADCRARFDADDDTVIFLFAGRIDKEKHPDVLVKAFQQAKLENARLVLSGEGPLRESFEEMAEEIEHFHVAPYETSREAFAALLASADVYVTAGPHETFGLSVVEAQASGLPVVGVNAGALRERVVEGTGYLAEPDDPGSMARLMEMAAAERKTLGPAARQFVISEGFGWDSTFEKLFAVYDASLPEKA